MDSPNHDTTRAIREANWLIERRRLDQARDVLAGALREEPENNGLLYFSAHVDYLEDDYASALETLDRLLVNNPEHESGRSLRFHCYEETGRYVEAEEEIISLLHDFPEDGEYYADYALVMLKTLHLEKASKLAAEAVRLAPESQHALIMSAFVAVVTEPSEDARTRLRELVRKHPETEATMGALVAVLQQSGKEKEALNVARQLLRANPGSQSFVDVVVELTTRTHWSMLPLKPMLRMGWAGSAMVWFVLVGAIYMVPRSPFPELQVPTIILALTYVAYSWIWPPILKRLIR